MCVGTLQGASANIQRAHLVREVRDRRKFLLWLDYKHASPAGCCAAEHDSRRFAEPALQVPAAAYVGR